MMIAYVQRAGVTPWPKLWQSLRSSCEKQWAMTLPQCAVSKWVGHRIIVSGNQAQNGANPSEWF
jgi:hypothetical protein